MLTIRVDRDVQVPMPDGVTLAADVFRPSADGRVPVVLLRTPYDRRNAGAFALQLDALRLVEAGFGVVTQDVRGRFGSGGRFRPFVDDGADGAATIEWIAEQPWSTGQVAMAGMSYCGYAQVLAARERPAPLRAWIPACCPLDVRDDWIYRGDAFQLAFVLAWLLPSIAARQTGEGDPARILAAFDDWEALVRTPPDTLAALIGGDVGESLHAWLTHRDDAQWWAAISGRGAERHDAAALVVGGWFDVFGRGTVALADALRAGAADPLQLLIGPWDHAPVPFPSGTGEVEYGSSAGLDLPGTQLRWLDHVLRGGPAPFASPARTFVTGANAWRDWAAWPPPAAAVSLFTTPGGALAEVAPPAADARTAFGVDAADPAPGPGGTVYPRPRQMRSGPIDQRVRAAHPGVLGFTAEPADRDMLIAGPIVADLWSSTSGRGADCSAVLVDVDPDGLGRNVATGIRRLPDAGPEPVQFTVDLGHVAHVVRRGHRLRLDVAGAAFPDFDRTPTEGSAERFLWHGGAMASRICLPVVA